MSLTAGELAAMRAAQAATMTETIERKRTPMVDDGMGGVEPGTPDTIELNARVSANGAGDEYMSRAIAMGRQPLVVTVPYGSDVVRTDTLVYNGRELQILGFKSDGAWATALRCVCVEVT